MSSLTVSSHHPPGVCATADVRQSTHNDTTTAIAALSRALELDPRQVNAYFNRALAWAAKGELDQAIDDYTRTIELEPHLSVYTSAFLERGNAWSAKGEFQYATHDFTEALRLGGENAHIFHHRGKAWLALDEPDNAIDDFDAVVRIDPQYACAYDHRGDAWMAKGDYVQAIEDFSQALRLSNDRAGTFYSRGRAWLATEAVDRLSAILPRRFACFPTIRPPMTRAATRGPRRGN